MFVFAPPVKVARTQRSRTLIQDNTIYASEESALAADLGDTTIVTGPCVMEASAFLSGTGRHMCWLVDENKKLIRLWNLSAPFWRRSEPRIVEIPYFAAAHEGVPLFVSEMDDVEESLAFCSERGAVSSLDHSVEFQFLDQNETVKASCFACIRRRDCGEVILTAVGTTTGSLVVDIKHHGEHHTVEFDRQESGGDVLQKMPSPSMQKSSKWWRSIRSMLGGRADSHDVDLSANSVGGSVPRVASVPDTLRDAHDGLAVTHAVFRRCYPQEVVCVNAISEIVLLEFNHNDIFPKWAVNVQSVLGREGYVITVAESRHRVCVLFATRPSRQSGDLPSLVVALFGSTQGNLIHYNVLNTITDVVRATTDAPRHHVKLYLDDDRSHVVLFVRHICVRVNMQVGVRSPCCSEDTLFLKGMKSPMGSVLMTDGSVVTLDACGPIPTWEDVWSEQLPTPMTVLPDAADAFTGSLYEDSMVGRVSALLVAVRADPTKMLLDDTILATSDEIATMHTVHGSNWARADLNAEDENIVLYVTRHLRRRQQAHRRFLAAVLASGTIMGDVRPTTIAQLFTVQEALLSLVALRGLQNVGSASLGLSPTAYTCARSLPTIICERTSGEIRLIQSSEQLERCQQILRRCVVAVAEQLRSSTAVDTSTATAAEMVFSNPRNVSLLLGQVHEYISSVVKSASVDAFTKFAEAYAVGCLCVIVAQTIVESRETLRETYNSPETVRQYLRNNLEDTTYDIRQAFSPICLVMANALAETVTAPVLQQPLTLDREAVPPPRAHPIPTVLVSEQLEMCDVLASLLFFLFREPNTPAGDCVSEMLRATLLRAPFVTEPFGYPFGSPVAQSTAPEVGRRVLEIAEDLALRFGARAVILSMCLATPIEDPTPEDYSKLQGYCLRNPSVCTYALESLWRDRREWELLCLPSVLPLYTPCAAERDAFLEHQAPHLLWLATPGRYDGLSLEGTMAPPYISYGPTQLSHRSRCSAIATLAWVASGAPHSARNQSRTLDAVIVKAQTEHLSPQCDNMVLGPQEVVQRLLAVETVQAWVAAAEVASHTRAPLSEDLLVQTARRCKRYDGDAIMTLRQNSVSELEISRGLSQTALGQVVSVCAAMQQIDVLTRICETVLSKTEMALVTAWLAVMWSGHDCS